MQRCEDAGETLVRFRQVGGQLQCCGEVLPRGFKLLHVEQEISEVDPQGGIVRVETYRLCVGGARGGTMAGAKGQGRELAERGGVSGVAADDA